MTMGLVSTLTVGRENTLERGHAASEISLEAVL